MGMMLKKGKVMELLFISSVPTGWNPIRLLHFTPDDPPVQPPR